MADIPEKVNMNTGIALKDVMAEQGVSDLPYTVRGYFAKALIEERAGNFVKAEEYLGKAVELEAKHQKT